MIGGGLRAATETTKFPRLYASVSPSATGTSDWRAEEARLVRAARLDKQMAKWLC